MAPHKAAKDRKRVKRKKTLEIKQYKANKRRARKNARKTQEQVTE